jgi:hypothetical protein
MIRVVLYGSCQLNSLYKILKNYLIDQETDVHVIQNWVYILDKKKLPLNMYNCDIFIYQPYIGSLDNIDYHTDTIIKKLKPNVKIISVPFIASNIYWPDSITDIRNNKTKTKILPFGKFPQQSCILSKYTNLVGPDGLLDNINTCHYSNQLLEKNINENFNKIYKVEKDCDIKILDFIKQNYKLNTLFHSIQHPTNKLLIHVANQIILKLPKCFTFNSNFYFYDELLKDHSVFILDCVQKYLYLDIQEYKLNGLGIVNNVEYTKEYFKYINSQEIGFDFYVKS